MHGKIALLLHGSSRVQVDNFEVTFDPRDKIVAKKLVLYGEYEREEIEEMCALINDGDSVLDVGAQIGVHTLYLSEAVGPDGKVIAVEPDPDNLEILEQNVRNNRCRNVVVVQGALGNKGGVVKLYQNSHNRGELSLVDLSKEGVYVKVKIFKGEDLLSSLGVDRVDFAKIDVEGYEPFVLEGLGRFLPNNILFEFNARYLNAHGVKPVDFLNSLVANGYALELVAAHGNTSGKSPKNTPAALVEFSQVYDADCNILAFRRRDSETDETTN